MKLSRAFLAGAALVTVLVGGSGMAWAGSGQPTAHTQAAATAPTGSNYVPITQCLAVNAPVVSSNSREFNFAGDPTALAAQGGTAGCGVPANATAVQAVISASKISGTGGLLAWSADQGFPGYVPVLTIGGPEDRSTAATLATYQGNAYFYPVTFSGSISIVIEGYYAPPGGPELMTGSVNYDGSLKSGPHITKSVLVGSTQYQVTFDRDITDCSFQLTSTSGAVLFGGPDYYAPGTVTNTLLISWTVFGAPDPPFELSAFNLTGICP